MAVNGMVESTNYGPSGCRLEQKLRSLEFPHKSPRVKEDEFLYGICRVVQHLCAANGVVRRTEGPAAIFEEKESRGVSVRRFLKHVILKSKSHHGIVIAALVFIDRLQIRNPYVKIHSGNAYRLFLTAMLISSKYFEDSFYSNRFFAELGGIGSTAEMNKLEMAMLEMLDYRLEISSEKFDWYVRNLAPGIVSKEADFKHLLAPTEVVTILQ